MSVTQVWAAEITKAERDEAGNLIVYGKATGPDLDLDQQIADPGWLKKAMPEWMAWGNLREMHQPVAAGVGLELDGIGDDWWLKSMVVDEGTAKKIEAGALKGYSIGIKNAKVVRDSLAPGGRINGGSIVEVSYVDRPCNPTAKMTICKSLSGAGAGDLRPVEAPEAEDSVAPDDDTAVADGGGVVEQPLPAIGSALTPGGEDSGAVTTNPSPAPAIEPVAVEGIDADSLAKNVARDVLRRVRKLVPSLLAKAAPAEDIASAQDAIKAIARIIEQEARGMAAGVPGEARQIRCLLDAVCALEYFCEMESYEPEQTSDGELVAKDVPIVLDAESDTTMAAEADLTKNTPTSSTTLTDQISQAVTEATSAAEKRIKALEADLAKVLGRPVPGGPVLARPVQSIAVAEGRTSALAKAAQYEALAADLGSVDHASAQGYRNMAAELRAKFAA